MSAIGVRVVETESAWALLAPRWNELLAHTANSTVFQTFEYLQCWWQHFGRDRRLFIIVAERDDALAIAPMQIVRSPWMGAKLPCLTFIGLPSELDRCVLLCPESDADLRTAIVDFIATRRDDWDNITLYEQLPDSPFLLELSQALRRSGYLVATIPGPESPATVFSGSWADLLATRSSSFRKGIRRKTAQLSKIAPPALDFVDASDAVLPALARYRAVEAASWKPDAKLGVAKSPAHWAFWQDVTRRFGDSRAMQFKFLTVGEHTVAGTFGLLWNRQFYSLHIAHDDAYAAYSPGVLLTALELEAAFERGDCDRFDFLGGFLANKDSWATTITPTVALYANRPSLRGRLFQWSFFTAKPVLRRLLVRYGILDVVIKVKKRLFGGSTL